MSSSLAITEINPLDKGEIIVLWSDAHRSIFREKDLRYFCPCAKCVDEMTGERTIKRDQVDDSVRVVQTSAVGHYGIKILWSDGHSTGIYSFEKLRGLCSCKLCQIEGKKEGT